MARPLLSSILLSDDITVTSSLLFSYILLPNTLKCLFKIKITQTHINNVVYTHTHTL